jgi:hypothetical protein
MDMAAARNTLTNGLNGVRVMVGQSGVTNGMRTLIPTVMVWSRERVGGKVSMARGGIEHGVRATTAQDGYTNMERAAAESTGTHTCNKIHGMNDSLTLAFITALKTQSSCGKFGSHLRSMNNYKFIVPYVEKYCST